MKSRDIVAEVGGVEEKGKDRSDLSPLLMTV
jgi:hypothetical protein